MGKGNEVSDKGPNGLNAVLKIIEELRNRFCPGLESALNKEYDKVNKITWEGEYNFFVAKKGPKKYILNSKGEVQGNMAYDDVYLDQGSLKVDVGGQEKFMLVLNKCDKILGPFDKIPVTDSFFLGYPICENEGKRGLYCFKTGKGLIPMLYDEIELVKRNVDVGEKCLGPVIGLYEVKLGNEFGLFFVKGNKCTELTSGTYKNVESLKKVTQEKIVEWLKKFTRDEIEMWIIDPEKAVLSFKNRLEREIHRIDNEKK